MGGWERCGGAQKKSKKRMITVHQQSKYSDKSQRRQSCRINLSQPIIPSCISHHRRHKDCVWMCECLHKKEWWWRWPVLTYIATQGHTHTHDIRDTTPLNIPLKHHHIHTTSGNWGPWARVPRVRISCREADKSTVNKPASAEFLFTTALSPQGQCH